MVDLLAFVNDVLWLIYVKAWTTVDILKSNGNKTQVCQFKLSIQYSLPTVKYDLSVKWNNLGGKFFSNWLIYEWNMHSVMIMMLIFMC